MAFTEKSKTNTLPTKGFPAKVSVFSYIKKISGLHM